MDVYFSHSYRDVAINGYFLDLFVEETIALQADQKTDVWCIAKLERYLRETAGFVSIIPARPTDEDQGGYSPYIGQELLLARRSRVPRLFFVDDRVLTRHRLDFPEDAVPFHAESVEGGQAVHTRAIRAFGARLETYYHAPTEPTPRHQAVVISGDTDELLHAAEDVTELLRRADYGATQTARVARQPRRRPPAGAPMGVRAVCVPVRPPALGDACCARDGLRARHPVGPPPVRDRAH